MHILTYCSSIIPAPRSISQVLCNTARSTITKKARTICSRLVTLPFSVVLVAILRTIALHKTLFSRVAVKSYVNEEADVSLAA